MGRTALYRDPVAFRPARAHLALEPDAVQLVMPDGRARRHELDGRIVSSLDGCYRDGRRRFFVHMLVLERWSERHTLISPPDKGAVAPSVVRVPEAPAEAAILDEEELDVLTKFAMSGGRIGGFSIADLARLAAIATPQFAVVIGEIAAERACELASLAVGMYRGAIDIEQALRPFAELSRTSARVADALVAALASIV